MSEEENDGPDDTVDSDATVIAVDAAGGGATNERTEVPRMAKLAAGCLFTLGIPTAVLGIWDVFASATYAARWIGLSLLLIGALQVTAGAFLFHSSHQSRIWGNFLGRLSAATGLAATMIAIVYWYLRTEQFPTVRLVLEIFVVLNAGAFWALLAIRDRAEHFSDKPLRKVAATLGVTAPVLLSFISFGNDLAFPAQVGSALNVSTKLEEVTSSDPAHRLFQATISLENKSPKRIAVVSSIYRVLTIGASGTPTEQTHPDPICLSAQDLVREKATTLDLYGAITPPGWYFAPGESFSTTFPVVVPNSTTSKQDLRLEAEILETGNENFRPEDRPVAAAHIPTGTGPAILREQTAIVTPTLIHQLMHGSEEVDVFWQGGPPADPADPQKHQTDSILYGMKRYPDQPADCFVAFHLPVLQVCVLNRDLPPGFNCPQEDDATVGSPQDEALNKQFYLMKYYGISRTTGSTERSLDTPPPAPTRSSS